MGISRSSTIVIGYLMSRHNMPFQQAYDYVRSIRPQIRPNNYFKQQLLQFEQELKYNTYSSVYRTTQSARDLPQNGAKGNKKKKNKSVPNLKNNKPRPSTRPVLKKQVRFE